jgi:hypothetical protein
MALQHLRASTADKRPTPGAMADGQLAMNTNLASPGLFFKDSNGDLVKTGPVHVGTTAPNATPASGGQAGNSKGELWLDTTGSDYTLKTWDGSAWREIVVTSTMIKDGTIVNADVNASAAIAGTKVAPDFGSQNVVTTGTATAASLNPTGSSVPTNGVYLPAANSVAISTNGVERVKLGTSEVVFNDGGNDIDFRIEGDTSSSLFFVDASTDRVGIGTTSPNESLEVAGNIHVSGADRSIFNRSNNALTFGTNNAERARIDSSGRLLVGTSTSTDFLGTGQPASLQVKETATQFAIGIQRASNDAASPNLAFRKTRSTTDGGVAVVSDGDTIGHIRFYGTDGTGSIQAAGVRAEVDGTPGANDMPGRLVFSTTADGASSPTERMRIDNGGIVYAGGRTSARPFIILGTPKFQTDIAGFLATDGTNDGQYGMDRIAFNAGQFYVLNGSSVGVILTSGQTAWAAQSDERLKTDLSEIGDGLSKVGSLRAVTGRYVSDDEGVSRAFLIAQDVAKVLPEAVTEANDEDKTLSLRYTEMIPLLVAALKESKDRIEQLESKVAALEAV